MSHLTDFEAREARVVEVARALHREYDVYERQPPWDDLHEESKSAWCTLARAAIKIIDPLVPAEKPQSLGS